MKKYLTDKTKIVTKYISESIYDIPTKSCQQARINIIRSSIIRRNPPNRYKARRLIAKCVMVAVANQAQFCSQHDNTILFDTDSQLVGIDNRCSACISHVAGDFIGPLQDTQRYIKGFGGSRTTNVKTGTIQWKFTDDKGSIHKFLIPNSYYIQSGGVRLLSPQHWAKALKKGHKDEKS